MAKLVLFGIGKIGQVVLHHFTHDSDFEIAGFTLDKTYIPKSQTFEGLPVVPFEEVETHFPAESHAIFIAIGYHQLNHIRKEKCAAAKAKGYTLASYISSQNQHISRKQVGENCFVMSGEPLQPHAHVGNNCFIWTNALIGHHSQVEDDCWITSNVTIGGNCRIGKGCFLGLGATIAHEVSVGDSTFIGAGALLSKNADANGVYIQPETPRFRLTSQQFIKMNTFE